MKRIFLVVGVFCLVAAALNSAAFGTEDWSFSVFVLCMAGLGCFAFAHDGAQ